MVKTSLGQGSGLDLPKLQTPYTMNKFSIFLGLAAFAAALTGCDKPIECDVKAELWVYNSTVCTPTFEVNGDDMVIDLAFGDSALIDLDEGTYDIKADLSFISVCTERDTTIESVCGESYTWTF